jgi:hypothetical protein
LLCFLCGRLDFPMLCCFSGSVYVGMMEFHLLLSRVDFQSNWGNHFKCCNFDDHVPVPCYCWVNFFFPAECSPPTNLLKTSEWARTNPKDDCLEQCISGPCKTWTPNPGLGIHAPTTIRSSLTSPDVSGGKEDN